MAKNKIKILWFADNTSHSNDLILNLDNKKYKIHLVSFAERASEVEAAGFTRLIRNKWLGQAGSIFVKSNFLKKLSAEIEPDIIYGSYVIGHGYAAAMAKNPGQKLVVSALGSDILVKRRLTPYYSYVKKYTLEKADKIHSFSKQISEMIDTAGDYQNKISTFPMGIKGEFSKPKPRKKREKFLIYTNRWHRHIYDNITILKSVRKIFESGNHHFKLIMAGEGPLTEDYKNFVIQHHLKNHVEFIGKVSYEKNLEMMRNADVYISASFSDGTSRSLLETMACGAFPVVSNIEANKPWIKNDCGYLFEVGSSADLAKKLENYMQNKFIAEYYLHNYNMINSEGLLKHTIEKFDKIFKELID